uniref:Hsp70-binding protein 1 n=1 Tax=Plectus sambesii TaxID=2011161 RepID=A0A914VYC3_9BILA
MPNDVPDSYWKALMHFAQQVGAEDEVNRSPARLMNPEDQQWLQEAMSQLIKDTDPVLRMKKELEKLSKIDFYSPTEEEIDRGMEALSMIEELACDVDVACDFFKVGGLRMLAPLIASPAAPFRTQAAAVVGQLCQNNPDAQTQILDAKMLPLLLESVVNDADGEVKAKALYGVSCLVRGNERASAEFRGLNGFDYLVRAVQCDPDNQRLVTKSAFLTAQLARQEENKDAIISAGIADHLAALLLLLPSDHQGSEHVIDALAEILTHPSDLTSTDQLALINFLEERIKLTDLHEDEKRPVEKLLKILNADHE